MKNDGLNFCSLVVLPPSTVATLAQKHHLKTSFPNTCRLAADLLPTLRSTVPSSPHVRRCAGGADICPGGAAGAASLVTISLLFG